MQKMTFTVPHKDDPFPDCLLDSLNRQTCMDFEVIIVGSSDGNSWLKTTEKWSKSLNSKVISAECGKGTARNIGAKLAKADILVVVDADVFLPRNFAEVSVKVVYKEFRFSSCRLSDLSH